MEDIKQIYEGKANLFKGTDIAKEGYAFKVHKVISKDFREISCYSPDNMEEIYGEILNECQFDKDKDYSLEENKQVILINGFDSPIIRNIGSSDLPEIKEGLKRFCKGLEKIKKGFEKVIIFGDTDKAGNIAFSCFERVKRVYSPEGLFWMDGCDLEFYLHEQAEKVCERLAEKGIENDPSGMVHEFKDKFYCTQDKCEGCKIYIKQLSAFFTGEFC